MSKSWWANLFTKQRWALADPDVQARLRAAAEKVTICPLPDEGNCIDGAWHCQHWYDGVAPCHNCGDNAYDLAWRVNMLQSIRGEIHGES